ncbi:hypothetical protein ACWCPQ_24915 [Nocardia sp. NPDC001965]
MPTKPSAWAALDDLLGLEPETSDNRTDQQLAFYGRYSTDPDDIAAADHIVPLRRSPPTPSFAPRSPPTRPIITVDTFAEAQLLRRRRAGTGDRSRGALERTREGSLLRPYLPRDRIRCDACGRARTRAADILDVPVEFFAVGRPLAHPDGAGAHFRSLRPTKAVQRVKAIAFVDAERGSLDRS